MRLTAPPSIFLPGCTIGVMGGGQLGRMFAIAARRMGYRVHTFSPDEDTPTGQLADLEIAAAYDDEPAVREFARAVSVLTFEFENIPSDTLAWCAEETIVRPSGEILQICQHRVREKHFLRDAGFPLPRFVAVQSEAELRTAIAEVGTPCVLKTAAFGYDGKGQVKLETGADLAKAWRRMENRPAVVEAWVSFKKELSIIIARGFDGSAVTYPVCENRHTNHILDLTISPARISPEVAARARAHAEDVAQKLELVGLLAVELFLLPNDELLINELAPRPHNSGHLSFDACITSQFEQQLRAVCGLPLGSTEQFRPAAMANLLGDLWLSGEPDWRAAAAFPEVKLHLYGKSAPRPGRKMGHLVGFGDHTETAAERAVAARAALMAKR